MGAFMSRESAGRGWDFCISSGLAGALRPEHQRNDVLAAKLVRVSEFIEGRNEIRSDPDLLRIAVASGAKMVSNFYTSKSVVHTVAEKAQLSAIADAVEMESFEILLEAGAWGARAVAVRSISDGFEEDLPLDFNHALSERGDFSIPNILAQVVKRPGKLPALLRFGGQTRRAAIALADFLDRYIPALAAADLSNKPAREPLAI
jgi:adenosylhomocysteine nucleosidase